ELIVVLQPVGVLAVAAVRRAAAGLDVGRIPDFRADGAQEGGGMEGPRTHLHVVGLQDHAALLGPEALQRKDQALEGLGGRVCLCHVFHRSTVKKGRSIQCGGAAYSMAGHLSAAGSGMLPCSAPASPVAGWPS